MSVSKTWMNKERRKGNATSGLNSLCSLLKSKDLFQVKLTVRFTQTHTGVHILRHGHTGKGEGLPGCWVRGSGIRLCCCKRARGSNTHTRPLPGRQAHAHWTFITPDMKLDKRQIPLHKDTVRWTEQPQNKGRGSGAIIKMKTCRQIDNSIYGHHVFHDQAYLSISHRLETGHIFISESISCILKVKFGLKGLDLNKIVIDHLFLSDTISINCHKLPLTISKASYVH